MGVVAYGVKFSDGQVVVRWLSEHPATTMWNSMDDMITTHGPGQATDVQWIDQPADSLEEIAGRPQGKRRRSRRSQASGELNAVSPGSPAPRPVPMSRPRHTGTNQAGANQADSSGDTGPDAAKPQTNGRRDASATFGVPSRPPPQSTGEQPPQASVPPPTSSPRAGRHSGPISTEKPSPEQQSREPPEGTSRRSGRHRRIGTPERADNDLATNGLDDLK